MPVSSAIWDELREAFGLPARFDATENGQEIQYIAKSTKEGA